MANELVTSDVFVVRHGECLSNIHGALSDSTDEDDRLTDLGVEQARRTGEALASALKGRVTVLASPLRRARETAAWIDRAFGDRAWTATDGRLAEKRGDEEFEDALSRAMEVLSAWTGPGPLIAVTHGHIIEMLVARCYEMKSTGPFFPINCGITYFHDGRLVSVNMALHLSGLPSNHLWREG